MSFERKDLVQDTATSIGTGAFVMAGTPPQGMQAFGVHTVGATFRYRAFAGNQWEIGTGTLVDATHIARSVRKSSSGNAPVDFTAAPTVMEVVDAADVASFLTAGDSVELSTLTNITPTIYHKVLLIDPGTGFAYTAVVSAILGLSGGAMPAADTTSPTTPGNLGTTNVTQTTATLNYSASTDNVAVSYYEVSKDGVTWTNNALNVSYPFTSLTAGTLLTLQVRAVDTSGNKSNIASIQVTTSPAAQGSDTTPPSMAGSVTATNVTATGLTMNYPAGSDNVGVARYEVSVDTGTAAWVNNGTNLSYTPPATLTPDTLYTLRARCVDAAGNVSNVLTAQQKTAAAAAQSPYTLKLVDASGANPGSNAKFLTSGTISGGDAASDGSANQGAALYILDANGNAPDPTTVTWAWGSSPTVPPTLTADVPPKVAAGSMNNVSAHSNTTATATNIGGWAWNGAKTQSVYGLCGGFSGLFAFTKKPGTPVNAYLYARVGNVWTPAYDNGTGTPIAWVLQ